MFAAGAGRIGDYERCSWYTDGTGTFLGGAGDRVRRSARPGVEQRVRRVPARDGVPRGGARTTSSPRCAPRTRTRSRPSTSTRCCEGRLYTDGGARGNPGPAAYGFVLEAEDGDLLAAEGVAIGSATNNVAEYSGLVAGLTRAVELEVTDLEVRSDSELMVKQMRGEYRVKNEALRALNLEAARLARLLGERSLRPRQAREERARRPARQRGARRRVASAPPGYTRGTRM